MNRKPCVVLLANLIAALPLLANAQDPRIVQRQAAGAEEPRIEIVRVKRTDSAAPEFQFRLNDGVVDLMRGVSLDSFEASVMPGRRVSSKRSTRVMVAGKRHSACVSAATALWHPCDRSAHHDSGKPADAFSRCRV